MRALVLALAATACTQVSQDFVCAVDSDCTTAAGAAGRCEVNHRCSIADSSCAGGFRFDEAAAELSKQCVSEVCTAMVRAGVDDTCTVRGNGSVWCWGGGKDVSQVKVPAGTITQLDDSGAGLCVRYADNKLFCARGASTGSVNVDATDIAIGANHACAITADGRVSCWGDNSVGQLGDSTTAGHLLPGLVQTLSGVTQLASGVQTSCAIDSSGKVWCWGDDNRGEIGRGLSGGVKALVPFQAGVATALTAALPEAAQVAVGDQFACSVTRNAQLWCWGADDAYQCGLDNAITIGNEFDVPFQVKDAPAGISEITAGSAHGCVRTGNGNVYCWGDNKLHQAAPDTGAIMTPRLVVGDDGQAIAFREISAGARHTCGTTTGGAVMCWGDNAKGQIGHGAPAVVQAPTIVGLACR